MVPSVRLPKACHTRRARKFIPISTEQATERIRN
jgi:hypothetical protein